MFLGLTGMLLCFVMLTKGSRKFQEKGEAIFVPVIQPVDTSPEMQAVRAYVDFLSNALDSSGTVGAAFTIVHDGKVIKTGTFGLRKAGTQDSINAHTIFRLASVSKGFAGALTAILEHEGHLSMDEKVMDQYPGFRLKDSASTADLTILHILNHTSGLVPYAFDNLVEAGIELDEIAKRLYEVDISAPPGALYGYQNVVFSLIDPILKNITGKTYSDLLEQEIFEPVGMIDASAGLKEILTDGNVAYPHVRGGDGYLAEALHAGYYNVIPAAGINASISDMGHWLLALLGNKDDQFPGEVSSKLADPVIYTPLKSRYTRAWQPFRERYYSLGWRIYYYRGRKIVYHGGYVHGYRAEIAFCPQEKVGLAFLQNSPNGVASRSIPTFFDLLFENLAYEKTSDLQNDTFNIDD